MDALDLDIVKANAVFRYRRLRNITKFFRFFELCLLLFFLSWTSSRLPFLLHISAHYFRHLIAIILSPTFIFALSNAIIITLLAKSGRLSAQSTTAYTLETDLCDQIDNNSENRVSFRLEISHPVPEPDEIVYQDKQIICEVRAAITSDCELAIVADAKSETKTYQRSQSEKRIAEKPPPLRRSYTEKFEEEEEDEGVVEKLSNEEFQRTVEAFIAKQVKFHQEEKTSIVFDNQS